MTTTTLQTDDNEDLVLVDGRNLVIITDQEAIAQSVRQATKMRLTENQYNLNEGVDYLGSIFSPQPDIDAARASISAAILSSPDVLSIEALTITVTKNVFSFVANISTVAGLITVQSGSPS